MDTMLYHRPIQHDHCDSFVDSDASNAVEWRHRCHRLPDVIDGDDVDDDSADWNWKIEQKKKTF